MKSYTDFLTEDGVVIFLFHGVVRHRSAGVRNSTRKHLSLPEFCLLSEQLKARGSAISMDDLVRAYRRKETLPPRAFVITFDDGFENNISVVVPVLRELNLPATFYITTAFVNTEVCSWTDRMEYALDQLPCIELDMQKPSLRGQYTTQEEKLALLDRLRTVIKKDATIDPHQCVDAIWKQLGIEHMELDPELDRKMTWTQLEALSRDPLFSIGGHGHTHRILTHLDPNTLECEIDQNIRLLQEHTQRPVMHYAYPEGLPHCYSEGVITLLRRYGIQSAVTAEVGINKEADDLFRLKRVMVTE